MTPNGVAVLLMDLPFYSRQIKSLHRQSLVIEIAKLIIQNYY
jgi:hypothetical protein